MTSSPPITVIGAGLGGLTLARVLQLHDLDVAVYDLDAAPDSRPQGGMLDMHEESGQAALRATGLYDLFRAAVLPGAECTRILDKDGVVHLDETDTGAGTRPEIQRETLRGLLLASLTPGTVRWGAKLVSARPLGDGRHELTFADGSTVTTDLLIGADGAWSRVRRLVSDATPTYSGISFVQTHLRDSDTHHPAGAAVVGDGLMFALGDSKGIISHREPGGDLEVYAALTESADWLSTVDFTDRAAVRAALLARFAGWDETLLTLITDADDPYVPRTIDVLPVGHRWDRTPGVTLLGDAAHLMSPFAGEGANLAMLDGAELAAHLVAHGTTSRAAVEEALAAYESDMFTRAAEAASESTDNLVMSFRADAPQGLLDVMASHQAPTA